MTFDAGKKQMSSMKFVQHERKLIANPILTSGEAWKGRFTKNFYQLIQQSQQTSTARNQSKSLTKARQKGSSSLAPRYLLTMCREDDLSENSGTRMDNSTLFTVLSGHDTA
uniref:Uncharacterized protein n=1 Tax=Caenorhabditis tropicalis TaxID=1561998 RepID=A0A1I7V1R1_9PELO